ncbi:MAG: leucine-rich repeat protein, partial [Lachnospiraceae bacterium]|nr:leucine-rich repeat protein [Lachnospiraceae bacterium]
MKKRVLALILASVITLTNGNIAFAAEADNENTTDTMVMEEAVGESTQPKPEEDLESEEPEEVAEDDPAENEEVNTTNTVVTAEKIEESVDTTSESTENITVETPEDVPEQGAATSGNYGVNMGDNIKWTFDEKTGTLTLYGNGEMYDLPDSEYAPWYSLKKDIKKIVVGNGITSIGTDAFYNMVQATDIVIPESVTVIKECALQGCESIKEVHLPDTIIAIGTNAFQFMNSCEGFYINSPSSQTTYHTENGVLFNGSTLICYPQSKTDTSYVIPYGTQIVKSWSFTNPKYLTTVYIPETVIKTGGDSFANQNHKMTNPITFWLSTKGNCTMNKGTFSSLPSGSKVKVKTTELMDKLKNSTLEDDATTVELYQQNNNYDNYNAMKHGYADKSKQITSDTIHLLGVHQDAATDCVTWKSSDPSVAVIVVPEAYLGDDIKDHIRYNEAETSCSGGYVKGGTKPGTATITVTREDKKESFNFTVENVVPTISTELYHHADGKQQVLGNSLCIHTGKSDTVRLQTVPGLTTALTNGVTWSVSDPSKVSVTAEGTYHEKATLYRKAAGDVTVTATMEDENGNAIQKSFQVIGDKSTKGWYVIVNDDEDVLVKDSTPVEPKAVVKCGDTVLRAGTDYMLSYYDNFLPQGENGWWGYVNIIPIGAYRGNSDITQAFLIVLDESGDIQPTDPKTPQNPTTANKLKKQKITKVSSTYKKSVGQSFTLKPKAKGKITYKTGNKKVATVNSKGKVTVKGTGKATITVTAKATSTYSKCVKKITVYGVPKKPEMKKLTAGKKKFTVQWKKDKKADGYQVQYSTDKKFKKNVKSVNVSKKSTKATVKKLKKGKTYRVRVRS